MERVQCVPYRVDSEVESVRQFLNISLPNQQSKGFHIFSVYDASIHKNKILLTMESSISVDEAVMLYPVIKMRFSRQKSLIERCVKHGGHSN